MASIIRIKRSSVSGNPSTLGAGELAYSALTDNGSNGGDRLYIGIGTETDGNAVNHFVIGGKFFTDRLDHTAGTLTANSALVVDADSKIDILNVDNLTLNGNTISSTDTNGNIYLTPNGTGKAVLTNVYIGDVNTSLTEFIQDVTGGQVVSGNGVDVSYSDATGTSTVSLNTEYAQDLVGAMLGGTQSGIAVTYDDATGLISFNVNDPTITIAGDVDGSATMTNLGNTTINVTLDTVNSNVGSFGGTTKIPTFTVNGKGLVTAAGEVDVATTLSIAGDTGTDTVSLLTDTLTIAGGEGIDVAVTNNTITISGEDASTSNKGVASFNSSDFSVTAGAVSISNVNLGTQTTGNYVATIAGTTNQISVSGSGSETAAVTLSLPQNIHTGATPTFAGMSLSAALAMGSNKITGLADPTDAQDAATKAYVDAARSGLDVKQSVRVATTGNITLSGTQTIDGIALSVGNRVLVKDQTNGVENGIYLVASGSWTRTTDADEPNEVSPGMFLFVEQGSVNADSGWVITSDAPLTVGTDAIVFTQFSGAGQIVAGNALVKTGNTLDVQVAASGGIEIANDSLQLKSTVAGDGLAYSSGVLSIASSAAGNGLAYSSGVLSVNVANGIEVSADKVQLASTVAGAGLTYTSGVLDVVGTSNRITVNADNIDIASTYVGQTSITTLGTIGTGTWQGTIINPTYGGTGVNNGTKTITLGGNFATSGAYAVTLTATGATNVTLPTTGKLATLAGSETLTNKTIQGAVITGGSINNTPIGATTANTGAFTTLSASGTITASGNITGSGAATSTLDGFNIDGGTY